MEGKTVMTVDQEHILVADGQAVQHAVQEPIQAVEAQVVLSVVLVQHSHLVVNHHVV